MKFNKVPNGKLSHIYLEINLMMLFFLEVLFLQHSTDSQICEKQEFLDFASLSEAGKKHLFKVCCWFLEEGVSHFSLDFCLLIMWPGWVGVCAVQFSKLYLALFWTKSTLHSL